MNKSQYIFILVLLFGPICLLAQPASLQNGMICNYSMDGDGTDISNYANHARLVGAVESSIDRFGNPCGALKFDGSTGFLSAPSKAHLNTIQKEFAVSVWAKMAGQSPDGLYWLTIICRSDQTNETVPNPHFRFQATSRTVSINTDFTENVDLIFDAGKWSHFVLNYDGRTVKMYKNTLEVFSWNYSKNLTINSQSLEIGRDMPGRADYFKGEMDDLKLYNRALTQAEIQALFVEKSQNSGVAKLEIEPLQDIVLPAEAGQCLRKIDFYAPSAVTPCGSATVTQIVGLPSGSAFEVGESSIEYKAESTNGEIVRSGFRILVEDREAPVLTCPKDIKVQADPGLEARIVDYPAASAIDNCGPVKPLLSGGLPSGAAFPIGTTKVTYSATDASANQGICSFSITVEATAKQQAKPKMLAIECPDDIIVATDPGRCDRVVKYMEPSISGPKGSILLMLSGQKSGHKFTSGKTVMSFSATSPDGQAIDCGFDIVVEDREAPVLVCPEEMTVKADPGLQAVIVEYPVAIATDNCGTSGPKISRGLPSGAAFSLGTSQIRFIATDAAGNQGECEFTLTVNSSKLPEKLKLTCPQNIKIATDPGRCDKVVTFEKPKISGAKGSKMTLESDLESGEQFPLGETYQVYEATALDGRKAGCNFRISVVDEEVPRISCPDDLTLMADEGMDGGEINFVAPLASDNCGTPITKMLSGFESGSIFPLGETEVKFVATDASNNQAECSFKVLITALPKKLDGERLNYRDVIEIPTGTCTIYYYDDAEIDGDVVSINVDGEWRVKNAVIQKKNKKLAKTANIKIDLDKGKLHFVAFKAIDEGSVPTCTMKLAIYDERHKLIKVLGIRSSAGESGAIILKRK